MANASHELMRRLEGILSAAKTLAEILEQETRALRERDAEQITALSEAKQQINQGLETAVRALHAFTQTDDLGAFFANAQPEQAALWQTILSLTKQCRDTNDVNGALIQGALRQTNDALGLLLGERGDATYDPRGGSQTPLGTRSYGKA